jgi:hypothetical protein
VCVVEHEVSPEPEPDARAAIERALAELLREDAHPAYVSAWRRRGIEESAGRSGDGALAE